MKRIRSGGKGIIDDHDLFTEICDEFNEIVGDGAVWKAEYRHLVSKSFDMRYADVLSAKDPDKFFIKQLQRFVKVSQQYNSLVYILANKRDFHNLSKNLKFVTTLIMVNGYGGRTNIMQWNAEDSSFDSNFLMNYRRKYGNLGL
jgi:hypothetical protein